MGISLDGMASAVTTHGNRFCHVVLRGGKAGPNYSAHHVDEAVAALGKAGLPQALMVDCSHDNSSKKPELQPEVCLDVARQRAAGRKAIVSVMIESNLHAGNQAFPQPKDKLAYGVSITDGCIDWAATERLLRDLHAALG
jgi:3-deoxy-7-phosphoheptulonate synthase